MHEIADSAWQGALRVSAKQLTTGYFTQSFAMPANAFAASANLGKHLQSRT
jgi:hypothetical protein